ncbi:hypothetical protein Tco_0314597, partial [Tanacetum coccineum]
EEQPLPVAASPTADSPGYVPESDSEEDDEDPEVDLADYPADRDDDDEDEKEEPFGDDVEDEDEEEEHLAPVDSVPPIHCMTTRISIRDEPSISLPPREEVERLLALTPHHHHHLLHYHLHYHRYHHQHPIALLILRFLRVVYLFRRGCVLLLPPLVVRSGRV